MNRNQEKPRIPENDPSKAMDSKKEVENSPDERTDQDFPGYPHYPAKDDIMDQRTGAQRADVDVENLPSGNAPKSAPRSGNETRERNKNAPDNEDDLNISMGNDADVTEDDLAVLDSTNAEIGTPQNVAEEEMDLDIPGSELDDENEKIGEEDEENNYYSLGGDRHEHQEEDPYSGPDRG